LMFAAMKNNDNVGLFLFTDKIEQFIPARKGRKHVLKAISTLVQFQPESTTTDLSRSLRYISKVIKKRSIVFVISDFFDTDFVQPLKLLKNKHDVIALRIIDQRELEIPDIGLIELEDGETGEQILVDTSDERFRKNYMDQIQKHEQYLLHQLRKIKIDMVRILTDETFDIPLKKFFKIRLQRVMR
ncbi:MAG TPA: VWA domain-containing protein, partial [Candidatus Thermoplasmatota archaeon]|nr:VWA domain-containing protein [Candidatus Thermoplasmatota archaeon]